ncbi:hypothetical protein AGMMS49928_19570 [Spirochaetia bacterium]|nr:hypothetical protein AGMMS49928_19570 [Spirochaetia bacterium]
MTRGIFIAGNESALFDAVCAGAAARVEHFAGAIIPGHSGGEGTHPEKAIVLPWNPSSPVSARTLVLAAENRLERIDEAVLVCAPPAVFAPPAALNPADVEILVNDHLKGWFFLVKELAALFQARKAGTLALVTSESPGSGGGEAPDLLGSTVTAAFRAFVQSLLAASFNDPYQTFGFSISEPGEETAFAAFVFKIMEENGRRNTGKWHKFGKFNNIFNR